jgi:hypothetical protein
MVISQIDFKLSFKHFMTENHTICLNYLFLHLHDIPPQFSHVLYADVMRLFVTRSVYM